MTISVIIPLYNGTIFIEGAILNLKSQTLPPNEIIVIDDGSTDSGANIVTKHKDVVYKYQENRGPSAARNLGISIAKCDLISFLDQDDIYPDNKLEILHNEFLIDDGLLGVTGTSRFLFTDEKFKKGFGKVDFDKNIHHVLIGAGLFKREIFNIAGLFDERLFSCEDFDWFQRIKALKLKTKTIEDCCLIYRQHGNNYTRFKEGLKKDLLLALHKSIALKKAQNHA
jgi:glycosyltransferase involved in cell wall biosynthesis